MLIIDHLVIGYNAPCVYPISFTIKKPGIYAIVGPNGSGKSTLLKTLVGLIAPLSGTFQISSPNKSAYVPQAHSVNKYFHLSLRDFVMQGYGPTTTQTHKDDEKIDSYLKEWQLSAHVKKCFHELSGGQKTRAMIVRALIAQPNILFLDETLASLDSCCQKQLMETLNSLVTNHQTYIFIVDHHLDKFKDFITGWIEFTKHHDDAYAKVTF